MKVKTSSLKLKTLNLFLFCASLCLLISCEKTPLDENQIQQSKPIDAGTASKNLIFKASDTSIDKAAEENLKKKFKTSSSEVSEITTFSNPQAKNDLVAGPTCCATFDESYTSLKEAHWVDCGFPNLGINVTYKWIIYETVCMTSPTIDYVFTVDTGFDIHTGTAVLADEYYVTIDYFCCQPSKYYKVRTFYVTVQMYEMEFSGSQTTNTVTGTSACLTTPQSITTVCPLDFNYCGNPAQVYIFGDSSGIVTVATQCALLCYFPPHVVCPSSITFRYRVAGSNNSWTVVTLNSQFNTINTIPNGDYEYNCTLNYSSLGCSSDYAIGTFHVGP